MLPTTSSHNPRLGVCVRGVHTRVFMSICTQSNVCTVHVGNTPKEEGLSRATVFTDGHVYLTGPRGECMYKNVFLYQKTAFLLSTQMLHPLFAWRQEQIPHKGG